MTLAQLDLVTFREAVCCAQGLEQLVTREVSSMHPIHVSLLDALLVRLAGYETPDEGLDNNDRFDISLQHRLHFLYERTD